jgi:hypothetical protein
MPRCHRESERRLFGIAEAQEGFFTTKQAKAAGFAENTHPYHVQVGNWIREYRGIYRLSLFPIAEHPDLVKWALWSRNRNEVTEGHSHQTALSLYELSDLNPAEAAHDRPDPLSAEQRYSRYSCAALCGLADEDVQTRRGSSVPAPSERFSI